MLRSIVSKAFCFFYIITIHLICIISPLFLFAKFMSVILQLYSTVTLRQGEKKHYNHKVDVYSFAIVLWELLNNKVPFEGMSNLQAAYAAAFKVSERFNESFLFV